MRHPAAGSVAEFAEGSRVPVINGGDGANEHPTQALLDLFTIKRELEYNGHGIDGLHIAMIGDLRYGRTVHSLSRLLCLFKNIRFTLISPKELAMPQPIIDAIENAGHQLTITDTLEGNMDADICYQTRIHYTKHFQSKTVIMHPLPRDSRMEANELDNDLNLNPNLAIFRQTDNGVLVRMALFALTLGVENLLTKYERDVVWYSNKSK